MIKSSQSSIKVEFRGFKPFDKSMDLSEWLLIRFSSYQPEKRKYIIISNGLMKFYNNNEIINDSYELEINLTCCNIKIFNNIEIFIDNITNSTINSSISIITKSEDDCNRIFYIINYHIKQANIKELTENSHRPDIIEWYYNKQQLLSNYLSNSLSNCCNELLFDCYYDDDSDNYETKSTQLYISLTSDGRGLALRSRSSNRINLSRIESQLNGKIIPFADILGVDILFDLIDKTIYNKSNNEIVNIIDNEINKQINESIHNYDIYYNISTILSYLTNAILLRLKDDKLLLKISTNQSIDISTYISTFLSSDLYKYLSIYSSNLSDYLLLSKSNQSTNYLSIWLVILQELIEFVQLPHPTIKRTQTVTPITNTSTTIYPSNSKSNDYSPITREFTSISSLMFSPSTEIVLLASSMIDSYSSSFSILIDFNDKLQSVWKLLADVRCNKEAINIFGDRLGQIVRILAEDNYGVLYIAGKTQSRVIQSYLAKLTNKLTDIISTLKPFAVDSWLLYILTNSQTTIYSNLTRNTMNSFMKNKIETLDNEIVTLINQLIKNVYKDKKNIIPSNYQSIHSNNNINTLNDVSSENSSQSDTSINTPRNSISLLLDIKTPPSTIVQSNDKDIYINGLDKYSYDNIVCDVKRSINALGGLIVISNDMIKLKACSKLLQCNINDLQTEIEICLKDTKLKSIIPITKRVSISDRTVSISAEKPLRWSISESLSNDFDSSYHPLHSSHGNISIQSVTDSESSSQITSDTKLRNSVDDKNSNPGNKAHSLLRYFCFCCYKSKSSKEKTISKDKKYRTSVVKRSKQRQQQLDSKDLLF